MSLLPIWQKPGVGAIEQTIRNVLQRIIDRLGDVADGFTAIDNNVTLYANRASLLRGAIGLPARWVLGTSTVGVTDFAVLAYVANTSFTIALPQPMTVPNMVCNIKKMTSWSTLYITGTIDGATGLSFTTQYVSYTLMATSSTWVIL